MKAVEGGARGRGRAGRDATSQTDTSSPVECASLGWLANAGPKGLSHLSVSPGKSLL